MKVSFDPYVDKITFGKYKGKTLEEIYYIDTSYILWLHKNIKTIKIPKEFIEYAMMDEYDIDDPFYGYEQEF